MNGFSQFYIEFLGRLWSNICSIFETLWGIIVRIFYGDWAGNSNATKPILIINTRINAI